MRTRIGLLLPAIACCLLFASQARGTDYAYGYTSIYVDSGNVVRGYHRTELDYNSDLYYTPYVCGELSKDGVQVVRACQGGYHSATRNTSWPYFEGSGYSALSDHYVDMAYQEEDPTNPGYYSFADYFGYGFSGSGGHPIDWYWIATAISNMRPEQSIRLGDTNGQLCSKPTGETFASSGWADSDGYPTIHKFTQTLLPSTTSFSGRTVAERDPGGTTDGCWQTGDPADYRLTGVTGGAWPVASNNTWGPDYEGLSPELVTYYRNHNRAPCSLNVPQQMVIFCGLASTLPYTNNILGATVAATTVSSVRNGTTVTRTWP